ncbi:hypothetical protein MEO93_28345, partial [Dolichospermum sp. ST_sed3]|nr:hypothetical protein [Dolichospermum sp. ST_sed3]
TVTIIDLSPQVGYHINKYFNAGVGITYTYYKDNNYKFSTSIYGGSVFAQAIPLNFLILHTELEMLNLEVFDVYGEGKRLWDLGVLVGAGYRVPFGEKSAVNFMVLWNLNQTAYSPYTNPIVRIYFSFLNNNTFFSIKSLI